MNGALLQSRINHGYAMAGNQIGTAHTWYRGGMLNPTQPQYIMGSLLAAWSVDAAFKTPPNYQTLLYRGFLDVSQAVPGDILIGARTFVMLETGPLMPPVGLVCTDLLTIERSAATSTAGLQTYIDQLASTVIAQGLPGNIQIKKEVGTLPTGLPADVSRKTYWLVSFYAPDGFVKDGDIITDGEGYRYQVTAANWQSIYYQCLCERVEA